VSGDTIWPDSEGVGLFSNAVGSVGEKWGWRLHLGSRRAPLCGLEPPNDERKQDVKEQQPESTLVSYESIVVRMSLATASHPLLHLALASRMQGYDYVHFTRTPAGPYTDQIAS
jgi:hypothetical protein